MDADKLGVMFDGWPLAREVNSPAALHLLELLGHAAEFCRPYLALPQEVDPMPPLPGNVTLLVDDQDSGARARLGWEQRRLAHLAGQAGAQLLHLTSPAAALTGRLPVAVSPAGWDYRQRRQRSSLVARLREALALGGMSRASAIFWPQGLPQPDLPGPVVPLPAVVAPDFNPVDPPDQRLLAPLDLPQTYLLYHGPQDDHTIERLLAIWSWAARSIGELFPLVLLGFVAPDRRDALEARAAHHGLQQYLQLLPAVPAPAVASLYRASSGVLHLGPVSGWGGPVRYALACGKPLVADRDEVGDALVGPAGYLFEDQQARKMGAALLSVVVNEDVAANLRAAALQQASSWQMGSFGQRLESAYRDILNYPSSG